MDPNIIKVVCALHSDHIEALVGSSLVRNMQFALGFLKDLDLVLWQRLSLKAGKINEAQYEIYETKLVEAGWPRSQRLLWATLRRPDLYPGAQRKLQEIKSQQWSSTWVSSNSEPRVGKGRQGPYGRSKEARSY